MNLDEEKIGEVVVAPKVLDGIPDVRPKDVHNPWLEKIIQKILV